jgi:ankyrin repeat protein
MKNSSEKNYSEQAKTKRTKIIAAVVVLAVVVIYLIIRSMPEENKEIGINSNNNGETSDVNAEGKIKYTVDQLTNAVLENDTELVKSIIADKSVDINAKDSEDKYPIEMVLIMDNYDMAKILLNAGADPYVVTSDGESVYDIAMKSDSKYLKDIFEEYKK